MEIDLTYEIKYIIKNSLSVKLYIDELDGEKYVNVGLEWDGKPFNSDYIKLKDLIPDETGERSDL